MFYLLKVLYYSSLLLIELVFANFIKDTFLHISKKKNDNTCKYKFYLKSKNGDNLKRLSFLFAKCLNK